MGDATSPVNRVVIKRDKMLFPCVCTVEVKYPRVYCVTCRGLGNIANLFLENSPILVVVLLLLVMY